MRCYRRSTQVATLGLLVAALLLLWSKTFLPVYHPYPISQPYQPNITVFFANLHQMQVEPRETLRICQKDIDVLVIVPSSVANQEARKAVRKSWSNNLPSSWPVVFYLGATGYPQLQNDVTKEGEEFGDIAQDSSFYDSYNNLTLKTLSLISWAQKFCKNANYVLKIDDDVYLNTPKFVQFVQCLTAARNDMYKTLHQQNTVNQLQDDKSQDSEIQTDSTFESTVCSLFKPYEYINYFINSQSHNYESYIFGGYMYKGVKVDRNPSSKWYLDPSVYKYNKLPPFLSGTAYMLSSNLISHILNESKHHPFLTLEDVYLSGIIGSQALKLKLSHFNGWSRFRPRWDNICTYNELLTAHGLSPSELPSMTEAVTSLDHDSCNGLFTYIMKNFNYLISHLIPRVSG